MNDCGDIDPLEMNDPICPKCGKGFDEKDKGSLCGCVMTDEEVSEVVSGFMGQFNIQPHDGLRCGCDKCTDWNQELKGITK